MFNTLPANPFPPSSEQMGAGGGGGSYVLPVASANTLGGVKVGEGLEINAETGVLNNTNPTPPTPYTPPAYSTSEYDTGKKWIDGKTIYGKVFDFGALPNNNYKEISLGADVDNIILVHGITTDGNGVFLPIPYISSQASYGIGVSVESGSVRVTTWVNRTDYETTFVIVEYTKTESEVN